MKSVFVLQHIYEIDDHEEIKFIGVYTSHDLAELAIKQLINKPGFYDKPDNFSISEYELNQSHWTEGYSVMTTIQTKDQFNQWISVSAVCLPNNKYQIIEAYNKDSLGLLKHLDIVECEEKNNELYAIKLADKSNHD